MTYSFDLLSARELEILTTYARLGSQEAAAKELGVHTQTIKNHLQAIKALTNSKSTIQAVWIVLDGEGALAEYESTK